MYPLFEPNQSRRLGNGKFNSFNSSFRFAMDDGITVTEVPQAVFLCLACFDSANILLRLSTSFGVRIDNCLCIRFYSGVVK